MGMRFKPLLIGSAVLALGACASVSSISRIDVTTFYTAREVRANSVDGLPTELHGWTTDAATALNGVRTPSWAGGKPLIERPVGFTPASGNRLVLSYGAGTPRTDDLCRNPAKAGLPLSGSGQINAALCIGDEYYSRGTLVLPAGAMPGSAAYQTAMNHLMHAMMPRVNPETELGRDVEWPD